jgi:pimeloyl-ACP methyl ester carboxylesterase
MRRLLQWFAGLLLLVVSMLILGLIVYWEPDRPVDSLLERWAPVPSQFVELDGLRVHLRDEGPRDDPNPIVLLHGTSSSLHTWEGWVSTLREQRRVVSLDLPDFGLTGPWPEGAHDVPRYLHLLSALLDQLQLHNVVLVGNSFGGQIAIEMALIHPDRVSRLILVDALAYPRQSQSVPIGFRIAQMPLLNQLLRYVLPRRLIEDSVRNVYGDPSRVTPELVDRYFELTLRAGNRAALPRRFQHLPTAASARRIVGIQQPTLILWGERDRLIPPDHAKRLARDIVGSQLVIFPTLGHVPQEEDPQASVRPVLEFLAR